jgi:hypothetical protein
VVKEQEGEDAKFYVKILGVLTIALKGQGRHDEALAVAQREMEGHQRLIRRMFSFASEEGMQLFLKQAVRSRLRLPDRPGHGRPRAGRSHRGHGLDLGAAP